MQRTTVAAALIAAGTVIVGAGHLLGGDVAYLPEIGGALSTLGAIFGFYHAADSKK